jgi:hypothetical protein
MHCLQGVFTVVNVVDNGMDSMQPEALCPTFKEALEHAHAISDGSDTGSEGVTIFFGVVGKARCMHEIAMSWGAKPMKCIAQNKFAIVVKDVDAAIAKNAAHAKAKEDSLAKGERVRKFNYAAEYVDKGEDNKDERDDEDEGDDEDNDDECDSEEDEGIDGVKSNEGTKGNQEDAGTNAGTKRRRENKEDANKEDKADEV